MDKTIKLNKDGARLCDQEGCEFPATHTLVWTEHGCYCAIHAQGLLNVAHHMGFSTPRNTVRLMTIDEMIPDTHSESETP